MSTYAQLRVTLAALLRDPSNKTFTDSTLKNLVSMGISEVGRIAPMQFRDTVTLVANTLDYTVRNAYFGGLAVPEVEVSKVELWDSTPTPDAFVSLIPPISGGYAADSEQGWSLWAGTLSLPRRVQQTIAGAESQYYLRVYGYSPYIPLVNDADLFDGSDEVQWAALAYGRMAAIEMLVNDRDLFTQWQTHSGNTDVSFAGLLNNQNTARQDWRMRSRAITRLRSKV